MPNKVLPLKQFEQQHLVYQFVWECMDLTLQNESRLSSGDNQSIKWSSLADMPVQ